MDIADIRVDTRISVLRPLHAKVIMKSYLFFQSEDGKNYCQWLERFWDLERCLWKSEYELGKFAWSICSLEFVINFLKFLCYEWQSNTSYLNAV